MTTGIYKLTFNDGTYYIGQATNVKERIVDHYKKMQEGTHTIKIQKAYNSTGLPTHFIVLDCHPDFLDIFESFLINQCVNDDRDNLLNTAIPKNRLSGVTQRTLNLLVENRHNSLVNILDILTTYTKRIEGLKLSIDEAEGVISSLEEKRLEEQEKTQLGKELRKLKSDNKDLTIERNKAVESSKYLNEQLSFANREIKRLRTRGFWDRVFNRV